MTGREKASIVRVPLKAAAGGPRLGAWAMGKEAVFALAGLGGPVPSLLGCCQV